MVEYPFDNDGNFDAGDDSHGASTRLAGFNVDSDTRLSRCARNIDTDLGGSSGGPAWLSLPRFAGVAKVQCLLFGVNRSDSNSE